MQQTFHDKETKKMEGMCQHNTFLINTIPYFRLNSLASRTACHEMCQACTVFLTQTQTNMISKEIRMYVKNIRIIICDVITNLSELIQNHNSLQLFCRSFILQFLVQHCIFKIMTNNLPIFLNLRKKNRANIVDSVGKLIFALG